MYARFFDVVPSQSGQVPEPIGLREIWSWTTEGGRLAGTTAKTTAAIGAGHLASAKTHLTTENFCRYQHTEISKPLTRAPRPILRYIHSRYCSRSTVVA